MDGKNKNIGLYFSNNPKRTTSSQARNASSHRGEVRSYNSGNTLANNYKTTIQNKSNSKSKHTLKPFYVNKTIQDGEENNLSFEDTPDRRSLIRNPSANAGNINIRMKINNINFKNTNDFFKRHIDQFRKKESDRYNSREGDVNQVNLHEEDGDENIGGVINKIKTELTEISKCIKNSEEKMEIIKGKTKEKKEEREFNQIKENILKSPEMTHKRAQGSSGNLLARNYISDNEKNFDKEIQINNNLKQRKENKSSGNLILENLQNKNKTLEMELNNIRDKFMDMKMNHHYKEPFPVNMGTYELGENENYKRSNSKSRSRSSEGRNSNPIKAKKKVSIVTNPQVKSFKIRENLLFKENSNQIERERRAKTTINTEDNFGNPSQLNYEYEGEIKKVFQEKLIQLEDKNRELNDINKNNKKYINNLKSCLSKYLPEDLNPENYEVVHSYCCAYESSRWFLVSNKNRINSHWVIEDDLLERNFDLRSGYKKSSLDEIELKYETVKQELIEMSKIKSEISDLKKNFFLEINKKDEQLHQARLDLSKINEKSQHMVENVNKLNNIIKDLRNENNYLRDEVQEKSSILKTCEIKFKDINEKLEFYIDEYNKIKEANEILLRDKDQVKISSLQSKLIQTDNNFISANEELKHINEENKGLLKKITTEVNKYKEDIEVNNNLIKDLRDELTNQQKKSQILQEENISLHKQIENIPNVINEEVSKLKVSISQKIQEGFQEKLKLLKNQLNQSQMNLSSVECNYSKMVEEKNKISEKNRELLKDLVSYDSKYKDLVNKNEVIENKLKDQSQMNEILKIQISKHENLLIEANRSNEQIKSNEKILENIINDLKLEISSFKTKEINKNDNLGQSIQVLPHLEITKSFSEMIPPTILKPLPRITEIKEISPPNKDEINSLVTKIHTLTEKIEKRDEKEKELLSSIQLLKNESHLLSQEKEKIKMELTEKINCWGIERTDLLNKQKEMQDKFELLNGTIIKINSEKEKIMKDYELQLQSVLNVEEDNKKEVSNLDESLKKRIIELEGLLKTMSKEVEKINALLGKKEEIIQSLTDGVENKDKEINYLTFMLKETENETVKIKISNENEIIKCKDLNEKLQFKDSEIEMLNKMKNDFESSNKDLLEKQKSLIEENHNLSLLKEGFEKQIKDLQIKILSLEGIVAQKDLLLKQTTTNIEENNLTISNLQTKIAELNDQIIQYDSNLGKYKREVENLTLKLKEEELEHTDKINSLKKENLESKKLIEELIKKITILEDNNQQSSSELEKNLIIQIEQLKAQLQKEKDITSTYREELKEKQNIIEEERNKNINLESTKNEYILLLTNKFEKELESSKNEYSHKIGELDIINTKNKDCQEKLDELRASNQENLNIISSLKEKIKILEEEKEALNNLIIEKEKEINSTYKLQISDLEEKFNKLNLGLESEKQSNEVKENEIKIITTQMSGLKEIETTLKDKISSLEQTISEKNNELLEYQIINQDTEIKIEKLTEENSHLHEENLKLKSEIMNIKTVKSKMEFCQIESRVNSLSINCVENKLLVSVNSLRVSNNFEGNITNSSVIPDELQMKAIELEIIKDELHKKDNDLIKLKEDIINIQLHNQESSAIIDSLRKDISEKQKDIDNFKKINDKLMEKLQLVEKSNNYTKNNNICFTLTKSENIMLTSPSKTVYTMQDESVDEEIQNYKFQITNLKDLVVEREEELQKLASENENYKKEIDKMLKIGGDYDNVSSLSLPMGDNLGTLEEDSKLKEKLQKYKEAFQTYKQDNKTLMSQMGMLKNEIKAYKEKYESLLNFEGKLQNYEVCKGYIIKVVENCKPKSKEVEDIMKKLKAHFTISNTNEVIDTSGSAIESNKDRKSFFGGLFSKKK